MNELTISKEEARKQFDFHIKNLSLIHTFDFDEVYDLLMERRLAKDRQIEFRKNITEFETKVKSIPGALGADPFPLEHSFADGLYIRKLTVPANTLTVTKIHAVNHAFFLQQGTISVLTEEGVKKFTAPYQGITKAGTKRIIYHHDEVIFTTVHSTKETNINKIEVEVIAEDFEGLDDKLEAEQIIDFIEVIKKERDMSFIGSALIIGGAGAAASLGGAAISASSNGGAPGIEDNYVAGPNAGIEQSNANTWANQLQQMSTQPDYGAIQPDWSDIWNQTQQQVQNYFSGTATQPGVNDQINASFAQRGMSGDPAASYLQAASGANEAQDLGNLRAQQNIAQNQFGLEGQQQWLNSNAQFQQAINPTAGNWTGAQPYATTGQQIGNAISGIGTGAVTGAIGMANNASQTAYLQSILNPTTTGSYSGSAALDDMAGIS